MDARIKHLELMDAGIKHLELMDARIENLFFIKKVTLIPVNMELFFYC